MKKRGYPGCVMCVALPWSAYGYLADGTVFFLSTQGQTLLQDSNNEDVILDGNWHPEWRESNAADDSYLYNTAELAGLVPPMKVARFWAANLRLLPITLARKAIRGHGRWDLS